MGRKDIAVLCGGCAGYNTSQDFDKLRRDALVLKPKIIIQYAGYNDLYLPIECKKEYIDWPFYNYFLLKLAKEMSGFKTNNRALRMSGGYQLGIRRDTNRWKTFEGNTKHANVLCKCEQVKYICILQPCLFSKNDLYKNNDEKQMMYHIEKAEKNREQWLAFYSSFEKMRKDYILDFSGIFDGKTDIWIDECHVNRNGNYHIANKIKNIIEKNSLL